MALQRDIGKDEVTEIASVRPSEGSSASTVERAADVLLLFASSSSTTLGVTEIAQQLGLSKASVHRILSSLRKKGIVEIEPVTRRYLLGPVIVSLGLTYLSKLDVRRVAHPELVALSRETFETATLSIRTGEHRVYVDQVTPEREVLMSVQIGLPHPLHAGASSKAFLAFLPPAEIEFYLENTLEQVTPSTVTDRDQLRRQIAEIRRRGYALSFGERQAGAGSVAAPVLDYQNLPIAVISVCGPAERLAQEVDLCAAALLDTTRRVSAQMGNGLG
ncbi:MAG: IclR family transcriptional regulator [Ferrimicrobium sp.]|nr:IclR family transcriptional regulator [Ferrimicrobium sp.]